MQRKYHLHQTIRSKQQPLLLNKQALSPCFRQCPQCPQDAIKLHQHQEKKPDPHRPHQRIPSPYPPEAPAQAPRQVCAMCPSSMARFELLF